MLKTSDHSFLIINYPSVKLCCNCGWYKAGTWYLLPILKCSAEASKSINCSPQIKSCIVIGWFLQSKPFIYCWLIYWWLYGFIILYNNITVMIFRCAVFRCLPRGTDDTDISGSGWINHCLLFSNCCSPSTHQKDSKASQLSGSQSGGSESYSAPCWWRWGRKQWREEEGSSMSPDVWWNHVFISAWLVHHWWGFTLSLYTRATFSYYMRAQMTFYLISIREFTVYRGSKLPVLI